MEDAAISTIAPPETEITSPSTETTETVETPEVVEETPTETTEETPAEPSGEEDDLSLDDPDGRKTDDKTRKEIAALKKEKPEIGKKWAEDHFRRKEFEKAFPGGVREARQLRAAWDAVGGQDGVGKLQESLANYERADEQFVAGDRELIENMDKISPQGLEKSTTTALDVLAENPQRFDNVILPHFMNRLDKAGLPQVTDNLLKMIEEGKGQEAYDLANQIKTWLGGMREKAGKLSETRKTATAKDPRIEEIEKREQAISKQERDNYNSAATTDVNKLNHAVNNKVTSKLFSDLKLSPEGKRRFLGQLDSEIWDIMGRDKQYLSIAGSLAKAGNREKHVAFVHDKYASLVPKVFRKLQNELYPSYKPATAVPSTNGKAPVDAPKAVPNKVYKRSEVDTENTPNVHLIAGRAYLKGTQQLVPYA